MLSFPVSPEKQQALLARMEKLAIKESDLIETFTKSGGKGGQNVNKVSTAVHLKHIPSSLEVKCSIYRTQGLNRYKARAILCDKLEALTTEGQEKIKLEKEKIIKQKNKKEKRRERKTNQKEIILEDDDFDLE